MCFYIRVYFLWFFSISTKTFSVSKSFITMTIDLNFYQKGLLVIRVNMCASSFYDKLCAEITDEELDAVTMKDEETGDEIFTDITFLKKIWNGCLEHGYISRDYDILGLFVDKMILK